MKTTLIKNLEIVADALDSGTITYDWDKVDKCNCGLVAKAITESHSDFFSKFLVPIINQMKKENSKYNK